MVNSPFPEVTERFASLLMRAALWDLGVKSDSRGTPWPHLCFPSITDGQSAENVLTILHKTEDAFSHSCVQKQKVRALFSVRLSTFVLSEYPQDFLFTWPNLMQTSFLSTIDFLSALHECLSSSLTV